MLTDDRNIRFDVSQVAHLDKEAHVGLEETTALLTSGQVPGCNLISVHPDVNLLEDLTVTPRTVDRIEELLLLLKPFGEDVLVTVDELRSNFWIHGFEAHGSKYSTERARGILPGRS